jgi:hypothetical protein
LQITRLPRESADRRCLTITASAGSRACRIRTRPNDQSPAWALRRRPPTDTPAGGTLSHLEADELPNTGDLQGIGSASDRARQKPSGDYVPYNPSFEMPDEGGPSECLTGDSIATGQASDGDSRYRRLSLSDSQKPVKACGAAQTATQASGRQPGKAIPGRGGAHNERTRVSIGTAPI